MHIAAMILGIASGTLLIGATGPYLLDILKGKTKPERATWWIWLLLNAVAVAAQFGAGATWSLLMSLGQLLTTAIIAVLSLKHGYGRFHRKDGLAMLAAIAGIGLWWWLESPLSALLVVIAIDFIGFWLTLAKAWKAPETETLVTWVVCTFAAALAVISVGKIELDKLLYPTYIMIGNAVLVVAIVTRRRVKAGAPLADRGN